MTNLTDQHPHRISMPLCLSLPAAYISKAEIAAVTQVSKQFHHNVNFKYQLIASFKKLRDFNFSDSIVLLTLPQSILTDNCFERLPIPL